MSADDIELTATEPYPVIAARGELDRIGLDRLEAIFRRAAALDHGIVILSLLETTYFDSLTVHAIMAYRTRLAANRQRLALVVKREGSVRRILEIVGIPTRVPTYESLDEALAAAPEISLREVTSS